MDGSASAQSLTRASQLYAVLGNDAAAHALLERAVQLDSPPAPTQLALARSFAARGDRADASRWMRGAMLRARPDGALLLELATIEPEAALRLAKAARSLTCRDAGLARTSAERLLEQGHAKAARFGFDVAFAAGDRAPDFLIAYSDLLADPAVREEPPLPAGPLGMPYWWIVATLAAGARLAAAFPRDSVLDDARTRELSESWIGRERLSPFLAERIRAAEPFAWIRLGDGEARFLLHLHPHLRSAVPAWEADAMARQIWHVWFGQDIGELPPPLLTGLGQRLDAAIRNADLLGLTSAERLNQDKLHYGFCVSLEAYVAGLLGDYDKRLVSDAGLHTILNESDPFLSSLLNGLDFLGVISPHPELAGRLQRQHVIGSVHHYDIPGETRLGRQREHGDRGSHFPIVYERIMAELTVPRRGAVFLVAGGLLGKIYCDRIRELGGIALDIGALADAWMGYNSRGTALDRSMRWQLPA